MRKQLIAVAALILAAVTSQALGQTQQSLAFAFTDWEEPAGQWHAFATSAVGETDDAAYKAAMEKCVTLSRKACAQIPHGSRGPFYAGVDLDPKTGLFFVVGNSKESVQDSCKKYGHGHSCAYVLDAEHEGGEILAEHADQEK
ncbi:MAG TPA: hypothetical protein VN495_04355 [Candidatus Paceibacterota bacterium]|nr:hypothetical protein [Candidatus Paceibacterota bacterium]